MNSPNLEPTHETGMKRYDSGLVYNVQMSQDPAGFWWQRHIWANPDGKTTIDPWIVHMTGRTPPRDHFIKIGEL